MQQDAGLGQRGKKKVSYLGTPKGKGAATTDLEEHTLPSVWEGGQAHPPFPAPLDPKQKHNWVPPAGLRVSSWFTPEPSHVFIEFSLSLHSEILSCRVRCSGERE